jgi:thiol-disulfide isomerase/thioredoxin
MIKALLIFVFLFLLSDISLPQDVRNLSSLEQIDSIKTASKSNVILVNFWASWCNPCVEEFPDLIKLKNDFADKGLRMIFISLDFPEEVDTKLKPFLKENNVDFTTYFCSFQKTEELMDYFDKNWDGAIPATFIFDKKGELKSKIIGSHSYNFYKKEISKYIE